MAPLGHGAPRGARGQFYRVSHRHGLPYGTVEHGGYLGFGATHEKPGHLHDRTGSADRPVVRVTPMGRLYRTWYDTVGRFHVEVAA